ncbi:MAG: hypothetical protein H6R18_453 [Proteobacteria bacterium]|nr:hypothetical protein [Pseudomonadota bacterium]
MLAIGYVVLVKQLLFLQLLTGSWLLHLSNVLLANFVSLFVLLLVNFILLRHAFIRVGIFTSSAVFVYFYIYTLQGHFSQLIDGLTRSPQYLINMLIFVSSPLLVGAFIQSRLSSREPHA